MRTREFLVVAAMATFLVCVEAFAADSLYPPMAPPFVEIVKDGEAEAVIVPLTESAGEPAKELNSYIRKMSGAQLEISSLEDAPETFRILIGDIASVTKAGVALPMAELPQDGLAIVSDEKTLALVGETELAQFYAVDTFLEKYQDVRWFYPYEMGFHCPERSTIRVGRISDVESPSFAFRYIGKTGWARRNRQNVLVDAQGECKVWPDRPVHTFSELIPAGKYFDAHPEFFPLIGGKRMRPESKGQMSVQLCTTNPELLDEVAKNIVAAVDADPDIRVVSVDPMDGSLFCTCADCLALDEKGVATHRLHSRRLLTFTNEIAERVARKYPHVMIKFLAYRSYVLPPLDPEFKIHPNVLIQFARGSGGACDNHPLADPACPVNRGGADSSLRHWQRLTSNICMYEYYWRTYWNNLPWPMVHAIRKDIPYFDSMDFWGVYTQWCPRNLATNGLNYYVAAKLMWDADLDLDALLCDFYEKCYGQAAEPMRRYHEALEKRFGESPRHLSDGTSAHVSALSFFSPELLEELDGHLNEAEKLAAGDKEKTHVRMMRVAHTYTGMVVEDYLRPMSRELVNPNHCWIGGWRGRGFLDTELVARLEKEYAPIAVRIQKFMDDNAALNAVDARNTEADLLKVEQDIRLVGGVNVPEWPERKDYRQGGARRNKLGWLAVHPEVKPVPVAEQFNLWIYGYDFDSDKSASEHPIFLRNRAGKDVRAGGLAKPGADRSDKNTCLVLGPFAAKGYVNDDKVAVTIDNPVGKWSASLIWAVYVMPAEISATDEEATAKALTDVEWLRANAAGFAEMDFGGFLSMDGVVRSYAIDIPSARP